MLYKDAPAGIPKLYSGRQDKARKIAEAYPDVNVFFADESEVYS